MVEHDAHVGGREDGVGRRRPRLRAGLRGDGVAERRVRDPAQAVVVALGDLGRVGGERLQRVDVDERRALDVQRVLGRRAARSKWRSGERSRSLSLLLFSPPCSFHVLFVCHS